MAGGILGAKAPEKLSLLERAVTGFLPDELSLHDIALLNAGGNTWATLTREQRKEYRGTADLLRDAYLKFLAGDPSGLPANIRPGSGGLFSLAGWARGMPEQPESGGQWIRWKYDRKADGFSGAPDRRAGHVECVNARQARQLIDLDLVEAAEPPPPPANPKETFINRQDFYHWLGPEGAEQCRGRPIYHWIAPLLAQVQSQPANNAEEAPLLQIATPDSAKEDRSSKTTERELNRWLRETWEAEDRPGGSEFFISLKRYKNQKGSPIEGWYSAGKDAGVKWRTSTGASGECSRKTIQNKVSKFKNPYQK